jgi:hypothetical protein
MLEFLRSLLLLQETQHTQGNQCTQHFNAVVQRRFKRSSEKYKMEQYLFILGGKIRCVRCNATSKRTKQQCMAPAIKGKAKCRTHGGKSTGPKTTEGKARCTEAKTVHGWETRQGRIARGEAMKRLRQLEEIGHSHRLIAELKLLEKRQLKGNGKV